MTEPLDRELTRLIEQDLSPAAMSREVAAQARRDLADAQELQRAVLGVILAHKVVVDGRNGAQIESVRPNGKIEFIFDLITDVVINVFEMLTKHSPVRAGRYVGSHLLYADGVESDPQKPPVASEYVFTNNQPYARKIERGISRIAPDGVYQAVATLAARRYGNIASIKFSYRAPAGSNGRRGQQQRQPAIVIMVR